MPKTNLTTFLVSAVLAVGGALLTLDWSQVVSPQTAGVIMVGVGGAVAFAKLLLGKPPAAKE